MCVRDGHASQARPHVHPRALTNLDVQEFADEELLRLRRGRRGMALVELHGGRGSGSGL